VPLQFEEVGMPTVPHDDVDDDDDIDWEVRDIADAWDRAKEAFTDAYRQLETALDEANDALEMLHDVAEQAAEALEKKLEGAEHLRPIIDAGVAREIEIYGPEPHEIEDTPDLPWPDDEEFDKEPDDEPEAAAPEEPGEEAAP